MRLIHCSQSYYNFHVRQENNVKLMSGLTGGGYFLISTEQEQFMFLSDIRSILANSVYCQLHVRSGHLYLNRHLKSKCQAGM